MSEVEISLNGKTLSGTIADRLLGRSEDGIEIKGAVVKDEFCHYSYEITEGKCEGDKVTNRKGSNIVHDDMKLAFQALHPHLASICEEVDISPDMDISHIQKFDETVHREGGLEHKISHFTVYGFKLTGGGDNEALILMGEKRLSTGDHIGLTTHKIKWDDTTYHFVADLKAAVNSVILEVEEYMNGKCAPKLEQTAMSFPDSEEDNEETFPDED
jgi:hypothetical protein